MECHKCKKEMLTTPICVDCGELPIAQSIFDNYKAIIASHEAVERELAGMITCQNCPVRCPGKRFKGDECDALIIAESRRRNEVKGG